jgi:hypothetical protein
MCSSTLDDFPFTLLTEVLYFLRSMMEILVNVDDVFSRCPVRNFDECFRIVRPLGSLKANKCYKFWSSWPLAKLLRDSEEPNMAPDFLTFTSNHKLPFTGGFRSHMRNLLAGDQRESRALKVCWGLLHTKRGCAPISEEFQVDACDDHKKTLMRQIDFREGEHFAPKFWKIWSKESTDKRSYGGWTKVREPHKVQRILVNPNDHACVESKRSTVGKSGHLNRLLGGDTWFDLGLHESKIKKMLLKNGIPESVVNSLLTDRDLIDMYDDGASKVITRRGRILPNYREWLNLAHKETEHSKHLTGEVAISIEPLKARIITKGQGVPYFVGQAWSKIAGRIIHKIPQFVLTTRTICTSDLESLRARTHILYPEFTFWVSGDYKGATDGLSSAVNQLALTELFRSSGATLKEQLLIRKVLGSHKISYPMSLVELGKTMGIDLSPFIMTNGQLMGSPISFAVLCVVNLVCYWSALEEYLGRPVPLSECCCLINGDDICFRTNAEFYIIWKKWVSLTGFTLSAGKNYCSESFVTINSEAWRETGKDKSRKLVKVPFLNTSLLLLEADGPCKIGVRECDRDKPKMQMLEECIRGSPNPAHTYGRVKHYWKNYIDRVTRGGYYSLVSPVVLGGCGLLLPEELRPTTYFTHTQSVFAQYGIDSMKKQVGTLITQKPRSGMERFPTLKSTKGHAVSIRKPRVMVLRDRMEPLREMEVKFLDDGNSRRIAADLSNCQTRDLNRFSPGSEERPYKLTPLSVRSINKAWASYASTHKAIKRPFDWRLEIRLVKNYEKQTTQEGPTDEATLAVHSANKAEMVTENFSPCVAVPNPASRHGAKPLDDSDTLHRELHTLRRTDTSSIYEVGGGF